MTYDPDQDVQNLITQLDVEAALREEANLCYHPNARHEAKGDGAVIVVTCPDCPAKGGYSTLAITHFEMAPHHKPPQD